MRTGDDLAQSRHVERSQAERVEFGVELRRQAQTDGNALVAAQQRNVERDLARPHGTHDAVGGAEAPHLENRAAQGGDALDQIRRDVARLVTHVHEAAADPMEHFRGFAPRQPMDLRGPSLDRTPQMIEQQGRTRGSLGLPCLPARRRRAAFDDASMTAPDSIQGRPNRARCRHARNHLNARHVLEPRDRLEIRRITECDRQARSVAEQRNGLKTSKQVLGEAADQLEVEGLRQQVDERHAELPRQRPAHVDLGGSAGPNQRFAEPAAELALIVEGAFDLVRCHRLRFEQQFGQVALMWGFSVHSLAPWRRANAPGHPCREERYAPVSARPAAGLTPIDGGHDRLPARPFTLVS